MIRKIENSTKSSIIKLLTNIKEGILSMITDYSQYFNKEELNNLKSEYKLITNQIEKITNNIINYQEIYNTLKIEERLKPLIFKCWNHELEQGNFFIHWYKKDKPRKQQPIISTTFDIDNSFCNSRYGITYTTTIDGFLAAANKDAATIIEDETKLSIYTVGKTTNNKIVNSYNLATPIITPKQVKNIDSNNYHTKYNEIILDTRYIKPQSIIYTSDNDLEMVTSLSNTHSIPIESLKAKKGR